MRRHWCRRGLWARAVIGEIELAAQFFPGRIVAITGSNGKTTTTTLTGEIVAAGGFPLWSAETSVLPRFRWSKAATADTIAVLEVSSFQLETIQTFRPKVAVVLNVTPDHLDRHRTFAAYVDAKARIFENQQADDFAVLNADDPTCVEIGRTHPGAGFLVQPQERSEAGSVRARRTRCSFGMRNGQREIMLVSEIPLKGAHNVENVLAAVCVGALLGCEPERIRAGRRASSRRSSTGWNMSPRFVAWSITTIPKPRTWMRRSRRWSLFRQTFT